MTNIDSFTIRIVAKVIGIIAVRPQLATARNCGAPDRVRTSRHDSDPAQEKLRAERRRQHLNSLAWVHLSSVASDSEVDAQACAVIRNWAETVTEKTVKKL